MKSRNFAKPAREIVIIAHNIRSILNVGAILRTAECFAIQTVFATGYTPNLEFSRIDENNFAKLLPFQKAKLAKELHKSALGAEEIINFEFRENVFDLISELRENGFAIVGLEQDARAIPLDKFRSPAKLALILGEEVHGLTPELREICDDLIEIPMFGRKESFNVSVATGICLYKFAVK
jgi:tRNA G18 (ribose-2'-O)-methylase SpoU